MEFQLSLEHPLNWHFKQFHILFTFLSFVFSSLNPPRPKKEFLTQRTCHLIDFTKDNWLKMQFTSLLSDHFFESYITRELEKLLKATSSFL